MIKIQYTFSENYKWREKMSNIFLLDDSSFTYDVFLGCVSIVVDKEKLPIEWEWIPLLDFSFCLLEISKNIDLRDQKFTFTESESEIIFNKERDQVIIAPTFSQIKMKVPINEFKDEAASSYSNLINKIVTEYPELISNEFFIKYLNHK